MSTPETTTDDFALACQKTDRKLNAAWVQWLTAKKLASDEDSFNDGLFQTISRPDIALDASERKEGQRLLLDVEKDGELRRREKRRVDAEWQQRANSILAKSMLRSMARSMKHDDTLRGELLKLPSTYADLITLLYSPSAKYRTIATLIEQTQGLGKQIMTLVNNTDFCTSIGRERRVIKDTHAAIGMLGLPALQMVVPLLLLKSRLKFDCEFYSLMGGKMWQYIVSVANITRLLLLEETGSSDKAAIGTAIGAISGFGMVAIHQQFHQSFDEVRQDLLTDLRTKGSEYRKLYNAMVDAMPDKRCIHTFLLEARHKLAFQSIRRLDWDSNSPIMLALREEAEAVPFDDRSLYGKALTQAHATARYTLLKPVYNLKPSSHGKATRYHARISDARFQALLSRDQRRIYLSDVIG